MNKKFVLSLVLAFAMIIAIAGAATADNVSALDIVPGGTNGVLFNQSAGNVQISALGETGVTLTLDNSNSENTFAYKQNLYMDGFAFDTEINKIFDTLSFKFTEVDDYSNVIELIVEREENSFVAYTKKDTNTSEKTEIVLNAVDASKTTETDMYILTISYNKENSKFSVNGTEIGQDNAFEYFVAKMSVTEKYSKTDSENDFIMLAKSISNLKGKQEFTTAAEAIDAVIWQKAFHTMPEGVIGSGEFEGKTVYTYNNLKGKAKSEYVFPVYSISIIGNKIDTEVYEVAEDGTLNKLSSSIGEDADSPKTKYVLGDEGTKYEIRLISKTEVHVLKVEAIIDEIAPEFNQSKLNEYIIAQLPNNNIYTKDSTVMPNLKENGKYIEALFNFTEPEGSEIDTLDNITVKIGYKKPGSTGDWIWTSNYTISFTAEGTWAFKYKVSDVAGNSTESAEFTRNVIDNTPPTIRVTEQQKATIDKLYTIAAPTVTDNESGVNTLKTTITLYKGSDKSCIKEENIVELSKTNSFTPNELTPDDKEYSYIVVYTAEDYRGNKAETQYAYISVIEKTADDKKDEGIDWLVVALVAVSVVVVVVIILMLVIQPKENADASVSVNKNNKNNKQ